jgi:hypothetical protein
MNHPYQSQHEVLKGAKEADASAPAQPMRLPADALVELLALEGCHPTVGDQGVIRFVRNELHYMLILSRTDPEFVRLILPNFYAIGDDSERIVAYAAANVANATCKAAKIYVERDKTLAAIECFLTSPAQLVPVLLRCAGALEHAARSFAVAFSMQRRA